MNLPTVIVTLCRRVRDAGGQAWLVGGSVRDHLLGKTPKDLDVEVHRIPADDLRGLLRRLGRVKAVGRSFGVFKLRAGDREYDVSLPQPGRATTPQGEPIHIEGDPFLGITEALRRRDLTINAIAYDPLSKTYADPFHGRDDLTHQRLRAVDPDTFVDDPLRVLRVMQFAGRFDFRVDPALVDLCQQLPIEDLPGERLLTEFEKLLLRSARPSVGLEAGVSVAIFSRLLPMLPLPDPAALDRAAEMRSACGDAPRPLALMLTVLLHRCGTAAAEAVLDRLKVFTMAGYPLRKRVLHASQAWSQLAPTATVRDVTLRQLAEDGELALIARAAWAITDGDTAQAALQRGLAMGIGHRPLPPLIKGRDLNPLGIPPGPHMGDLLRAVRAEQIAGRVQTAEDALTLVAALWAARNDDGA